MQLIGKHRLTSIQGISEEVDLWVAAWVTEVSHATWKDSSSLLAAFPRAIKVEQALYTFPVCGKDFPQIKIKIKFGMDKAMISEVIK
jgi:mRNA-degrading endonuclease HigB of HigAB toxin-antitoxin module